MRRLIFILCAIIGVSQAQTIQYIGAPTTTVISRGNFRTDSIFYLPKRSKSPTDTAAFRYQISDSSLYVWTGSQWIKAGGSGTITGSGITGYLPQFSASTTLDTSALFTIGNRLGIGSSTFAYNSTNTANVELNGTAGGILGFKRNDSARGYLWHTGDNMELANTVAGSISFNTNSATRGSISSAGVWRLHNLAGTGDRVVVASSNGTLSASTSVTGLVDTLTISTRAWRQKGIDSVVSIIPAAGVGGSGTTNYVPKFTAASTIGNSIIFDNATNVGIGTASPAARLHIVGAELRVQNDNALYSFRNAAGTRTGYLQSRADAFDIWNDQAVPMVFGTNNTERLRITSDGDILHRGTYNPLSAANRGNIMLNGSASNIIGFSNNSALRGYIFHTDSDFQFYNNTTGGRVGLYTEGTARLWIQANGRIGINTTTDAGYQLDINGTLRSVNGANFATTSGNVGIGTASPAYKFHTLTSDATIAAFRNSGAANGQILIGNTAGDLSIRTLSTGDSYIFSDAGKYLDFGSNASFRMRLTSDGELLVSTTTDAGDYKLQVSGNIYNTGSAVLAATSGNVGIGTASPSVKLDIGTTADQTLGIKSSTSNYLFAGTYQNYAIFAVNRNPSNGVFTDITKATADIAIGGLANEGLIIFNTTATNNSTATERMRLTASGELLINTTTDAGDYKLQVVGNARVGTGKLDIVTNTAFGLSVSRSGTDVVAQQINNSTGILYYGAESSTGGGLFTGSSAYAAVIGSGAAYPLQFATDNVTRATINTNGELLINTTTDNGDFKLQVNGNALISGSIKTANGTSSTAVPWHLGSVVATNVQLDTANYVEVEINGTFYRLAIVTPL